MRGKLKKMGFSCNPIFVTLSAEVARVKNKSVLKIENKLLARDQKLLEWGINMKIVLATCATNFGEKERLLADRRLNLIKFRILFFWSVHKVWIA